MAVIDMRSDTVTKPTQAMRKAMMEAEVGDDVYGEDMTVKNLQEKMAALLGKESALFFPSGTMSNLAAIMAHANERGDEVLLGDRSHIAVWEQGGVSTLGGVFARQVRNLSDGRLDLEDLQTKIYSGGYDGHYCHTKVIVIENTHNYCGGSPISLDHMEAVACIAHAHSLKIHVDGARLFNASTALKVGPDELVKHADSVSVCLSKGLGAPVGSLLVGSRDVIDRCHRIRKSLGGGMRQIGVLAAAGIVALDTVRPLLVKDHENAKRLAIGIANMKDLGVSVDMNTVRSNMVLISIKRDDLIANQFCELLQANDEDGKVVKMSRQGTSRDLVRAVLHHQISSEDVDIALEKVKSVLIKTY